jgi:alpha/beta superfamily hydrolase
MGNSFAHADNVTRSEPHGQETCPSYNFGAMIVLAVLRSRPEKEMDAEIP